MKVSFIIPVKNNFKYTLFTYNSIRSQYPTNEIVIVSKSTDKTDSYFIKLEDNNLIFQTHTHNTLSEAYNLGVSIATKDIIVLIHNDMFIGKGFIEAILEDISPKTILTYTRIEPPVFNDTYPGKEILNCGYDLDDFNQELFDNFCLIYNKPVLEGGSQLFLACYKEDYIGLDGSSFQMFCEDDDLHLRYRIGEYNMKVSTKALVYHLVSKTSRAKDNSSIEQQSNLNFIKKWGFRNSQFNKVYNKKLICTNPELKSQLDIWFNDGDDIIVEVDNNFTQEDYSLIQQLNDIIFDSGDIGTFQIGNVKLTINSLESQEHKLIKL